MGKNKVDWKNEFEFVTGNFNYEIESASYRNMSEDIYDAVSKFYQKEKKRNKTVKKTKKCWQ